MTPEEFAANDLRKQQEAAADNKPCKVDPPPRSAFESDADHQRACELQKKWCTKPGHIGDRAVPRAALTKSLCTQCRSAVVKQLVASGEELPVLPEACTFEEFRSFSQRCTQIRFDSLKAGEKMAKFRLPIEHVSASSFATEHDYERAKHYVLECKKDFCASQCHAGARLIPEAEQTKFGFLCRSCVNAEQRGRNDVKSVAKSLEKVARFKTAEEWFQLNRDKAQTRGRHVVPKREEFATAEAFEAAQAMERQRNVDGDELRMSKREQADRCNEALRKVYAEKKRNDLQSLKRKMKMDNKNKVKQMKKPVPEGMARCRVGPHYVPESDAMFCPIADLGMVGFKGTAGRCKRQYCKVHFKKATLAFRKFKKTPKGRMLQMKQDAKSRGFEFNLTQAKLEEITGEDAKCYHCHGTNNGRPLGADRIDPNVKAYTDDGVVPSCSQCNMSRNLLGMDEFHQACRNVANYELSGENTKAMVPWTMSSGHKVKGVVSYGGCKSSAAKRKLAFELTQDQYQKIRRKPCHYCGLHSKHHIGIDRLDNSQGYTIVNSRPSCTTCNMMKKTYSRDSFVAMCVAVARAHP